MTQPPTPPASPVHDREYPGLFITFEGGDGVGKSTQITRLAQLLNILGVAHEESREPGGTDLGAEIRRLLLHGGEVAPRAEALLYAADRAHHVSSRILPALEAGKVFISDRYLDSSVAYQGAARALGPEEVRQLSLWATGGLLPDLTILLDADPAIGRSRTASRGEKDRLEREPSAFHRALREEFLALAVAEPDRFLVIDATASIEAISAEIATAVLELMRTRMGRSEAASHWNLAAVETASAQLSGGEAA